MKSTVYQNNGSVENFTTILDQGKNIWHEDKVEELEHLNKDND